MQNVFGTPSRSSASPSQPAPPRPQSASAAQYLPSPLQPRSTFITTDVVDYTDFQKAVSIIRTVGRIITIINAVSIFLMLLLFVRFLSICSPEKLIELVAIGAMIIGGSVILTLEIWAIFAYISGLGTMLIGMYKQLQQMNQSLQRMQNR